MPRGEPVARTQGLGLSLRWGLPGPLLLRVSEAGRKGFSVPFGFCINPCSEGG